MIKMVQNYKNQKDQPELESNICGQVCWATVYSAPYFAQHQESSN